VSLYVCVVFAADFDFKIVTAVIVVDINVVIINAIDIASVVAVV
jgi:hypothetical protein